MLDISIDSDELDQFFKESFNVEHGFVKGMSYFWRETPHTGFFGPQNGAVFALRLVPWLYPAIEYSSDDSAISISLDATWFFHAAYGVFEKYGPDFAKGPMKKFNDSSTYHMVLKNAGNIEPGHYMFAVECRARDKLKITNGSIAEQIISHVEKIIETFREVVKQLWPGSLEPDF
ncbi:MAG: hypothetical protein GF411_13410 [Candidatus Lokiarchaeota archaeon]|nr:hypothetical protein [Candidatus Lokiarchaeota archaeon]